VGIREAYNLFCDEQEAAVWMVSQLAQGKSHPQKFDQATPVEYIAVRAATLSFAMKLLAEKTIVLETEYLKEEKTNEKQ
ncbi:TPA: fatty acid-binding protein DegV, partial [Enterococcus faecium]